MPIVTTQYLDIQSCLVGLFVFQILTFSLIFTENLQVETPTLVILVAVSMNGSIGVNIYSVMILFPKIPIFSFLVFLIFP